VSFERQKDLMESHAHENGTDSGAVGIPGNNGESVSEPKRELNPVKRFLKLLGPGLVTGASDDDPSGITTYAMAGASLGYATLWTALLTFPLMAAVQFISAKIGLVSGRGIAEVIRRHYSRLLLYPVVLSLVVANTINAAADIWGIAAGINLLLPIPVLSLVVPVGLSILVLQVWGSYRLIARTFKWLTLALFAYIGSALFARPEWAEVLPGPPRSVVLAPGEASAPGPQRLCHARPPCSWRVSAGA
jgi:Mn2+/Fe2+ NRAMP family transporter